jgi:hypothetical protein
MKNMNFYPHNDFDKQDKKLPHLPIDDLLPVQYI